MNSRHLAIKNAVVYGNFTIKVKVTEKLQNYQAEKPQKAIGAKEKRKISDFFQA